MSLIRRRRRKPGPVRLCHVTTTDISLAWLYTGRHRFFIQQGYEVWGVSSADSGHAAEAEAEGLRYYPIKMSRTYGVFQNAIALVRMYRFFRRMDFDIVEAGTLTGGFLGMLAAALARVPVRIYTLHGLAYELTSGILRFIVKNMYRWSCRLSHQVLPVCHEMGRRCVQDHLCSASKVRTVLAGSCNGIDLSRFTLTDELRHKALDIRRAAGIPEDAVVVGTVARLKIEKGTCELVEAFLALQDRCPNLWLLLVGNFETMQDPVPPHIEEIIRTHPRIHYAGFQAKAEPFYAAMDIFALPSHREGFGIVIIEASAMELPVITCNTMGCREAAADGESGLLVPVSDANAIAVAMELLVNDKSLRKRLGQQGRRRVEELFDQKKLWPALEGAYRELLAARGLPLPIRPTPSPDRTSQSD